MVVPKKQDFWPKTDILKGNNCNWLIVYDSLSKIEVIKKNILARNVILNYFLIGKNVA